MSNQLTGAEIVFKALNEHGVKFIFGYPGGAVLPLYDEISKQKNIKHILVRHEQEQVMQQKGTPDHLENLALL